MKRRFHQLDVFSAAPLKGNPLAVVHDAAGLSEAAMADFARWTNLSETTFLLAPTDPAADYRVRIFTPGGELPFAGHPTVGSCHAWLVAGGVPREPGEVVQECGVGLVHIRRSVGHGWLLPHRPCDAPDRWMKRWCSASPQAWAWRVPTCCSTSGWTTALVGVP